MKMNRYKTWVNQGKYKSFRTGARMILVLTDKGATLEPLYKSDVKKATK